MNRDNQSTHVGWVAKNLSQVILTAGIPVMLPCSADTFIYISHLVSMAPFKDIIIAANIYYSIVITLCQVLL